MNCSIIYYAARKTSWCEKALRRSFHEMGLTVSSAVFTTGSEKLGEELIRAFAASDVVFTVGGLDFNDGRSICEIISQAAAGSRPQLCRRLRGSGGSDGYLLRAGRQLLVMLPDEPAQIEAMTRGALTAYVRAM